MSAYDYLPAPVWRAWCWCYRKWNFWRGKDTADIPPGSKSNGWYD